MLSKTTKFENLLEAVPDSLVGMDQEGMIRFVNRQTESLFGYDRHDLIGGPIETLVPEPLWQIYASHRAEYSADPRTRSSGLDLELSGRRRNGTQFPVIVSLSHIDTGDVLLVITALHATAMQRRAIRHAELMAAIVEYSDDAIIGCTLEGVVTSWNPAAERMYGYWSHEIVGKSVSVLVPTDLVGESYANLSTVRGGEVVERLETMGIRKKGSLFPVSLTLAPILGEDGVIVGASAVHRDVTEQRRAFEVAQRMEALVKSSEDAIISLTLEGIVTSWNPAAERMYGYSNNEVLGRSIRLMIPEDRRDEVEANLDRIRAGQRVERHQTARVRKDGTLLSISLTVSPIHDADGVVVGASGIGRDLTEQELAAQYARSLVEADLDPLMMISPEGTIKDVNEAAVRITGYSRKALIGTDYAQYVREPDKAHGYFRQAFEQGTVTNFPMTVRHTGGTLTDVLCNASVYRDVNGVVLGLLTTSRETADATNNLGSPGA